MLRVSREKAVGEEFGEGEACVLWPVLDIVPHCGLKFLHEFWRGRAQLLDHFVPLINIWCGRPRLRETHMEYRASCHPAKLSVPSGITLQYNSGFIFHLKAQKGVLQSVVTKIN